MQETHEKKILKLKFYQLVFFITFINKEDVFAGENDIFVSGLALPNNHLYLIIKDEDYKR